MDADLKNKWLAALRSGDYTQGKGILKTTTGSYCCLGVLCNIYDPTKWQFDGSRWGYQAAFPDNHVAFLIATLDTFGEVLGFQDYGQLQKLMRMNDADGKTFNDIADWVEKNVEVD